MRIKILLILCCLGLFLSACTDEKEEGKGIVPGEKITSDKSVGGEKPLETETTDSQKEKEEIEVKPLPTTLDELANLPVGYTGDFLSSLNEEDRKIIDELTKDLPDISNEPSQDELDNYYSEILAVFQHDFQGPEDIIEELKFQSLGSPEVEDPRMQFKENLNVMVILDASGSMGKEAGGATQMDAAKSAITNFVSGLPENANVGLRIYGQEGTGNKADKELSCNSSKLIYPIGKYNQAGFNQALAKAKPAGWTPIQLALNEAQKDLASYTGDKNTNIVYLVSDGVSTCDDDPIEAAKKLYDSNITPIVNVIGFNVDHEGQKQLKSIADATKGTYQDVQNAEGLQEELDQASKVAEKWKQWKTSTEGNLGYERTSNSLDIFVYHSKEFGKYVDERQQIGFTLTYLLQDMDKMSRESHDYLKEKNTTHHNWIEEEYDKLRDELKAMNEMNYSEAIKALEETYQSSTP
jgi:Ca-activated chloride channel family protein